MSMQNAAISRTRNLKSARVAERIEKIVGEGLDLNKFVESFDIRASAAGGVAALRKLILELAIRGRLSSSSSKDSSSRDLFNVADADRRKRQDRGEARQMVDLAEVTADEHPFLLPPAWTWTRIGLAVNLVNGRAFKPSDWSSSGLPIVRIQNLNSPTAPFNYCAFDVEPKHIVEPGDFLISWSGTPGTSFGAFIWFGPKGVLNQHIFRAEVYGGSYDLGFLKVAINARLDEMIAQSHGGVGLQHITKGKLEAMAIPLPPLAEQKRIVAKVDELMALIDELEAKQKKKRELGDRLTKAALEALTAAQSPEEFDTAWQRVVDNFDVLVDRSEKVAEVRQAIYDIAMFDRLGGGGATISEDSSRAPFVPVGWKWAPLGELGRTATGTTPPTNDRTLYGGELPFVAPGDMNSERVSSATKSISKVGEGAARIVARGSVLMVCIGGSIGKTSLTSLRVAFNQQINAIEPAPGILGEFLLIVMRSTRFQREVKLRSGEGTMPILNKAKWTGIPVPVPSLAQQQSIVSAVEKFIRLCDDVEAKLRVAENRAAKLAEAVVQELVA